MFSIKYNRSKYYRYTQNNNFLTDDQRQFYEENGYVIKRQLVDHDLIEQCRQRFVDICDGKVDLANMFLMKDMHLKKTNAKGEFLISKLQDFLFDDVLYKFAMYKPIVDVVSSIIGEDITAFNSMLINKPPDTTYTASNHYLHQDLYYFPFRPADQICASWTAMERTDTSNGCLFVVPRSHRGVLHPHAYPEGSPYHAVQAQGVDRLPRVNLIMKKGDTVFFHPLLMHGSGVNCTKGFRKGICVHYANSNCHFIDVRGTCQERVAEEVLQIYKRRGQDVDYKEFIMLKSRQIAGKPGVFQNHSKL